MLRPVRRLQPFKGHTDSIDACAFSPDGRRVVSASSDKTLKIWDAKTGNEITTFKGHTYHVHDCAFSSDGYRIVSGSGDTTLRIWNIETGEEITILKDHTNDVNSCAFSPDGKCIVLGDSQGQVLLVSIENDVFTIPFVTSIRIRNLKTVKFVLFRVNKRSWDGSITAACKWCGKRFPVSENILDLIRSINRNAGITPDQSPILCLPDEAWDDPGLISECPLCHKPLKYNPFIVDNKDK